MILDKSIEMMIKHFDDSKFIYGDRPEGAFEGDYDAYVHVPFCMSTCDFCTFYKELYRHVKKCGYHKAILTEIANMPMSGTIKNLQFGGGTPNLLSVDEIEQIIKAIRVKVNIERISFQALPSILSVDYLQGLKRIGVNQIELGFESFTRDMHTNFGRRTESIPHLLELIAYCRQHQIEVSVSLIAGLPEQRETSFIEDIHLVAELWTETIKVQPLIVNTELPDERAFELIELAAEILLEKGYKRTSIWSFSRDVEIDDEPQCETLDDDEEPIIYPLPCVGFGPSAYSLHNGYYVINPDMDLYIYEQLYGKSRVLKNQIKDEDLEWNRLVAQFYQLDGNTTEELPSKMNWYIRWLQFSGLIKNKTLTDKGIRYAHGLVYAFIANKPRPIQNAKYIDNPVVYEAERSFASISVQEMETATGITKILGMPLK